MHLMIRNISSLTNPSLLLTFSPFIRFYTSTSSTSSSQTSQSSSTSSSASNSTSSSSAQYTQSVADNHFGFKQVPTESKQSLVNEVFHSVANKYDVMNDAMSIGIHRYWKNCFVQELGNLAPATLHNHNNNNNNNNTIRVLDVAGGTGDISFRILAKHNYRNVKTTVFDINQSMLDEGLTKSKSLNLKPQQIQFICGNAEELPFLDNTFDAYTISFGLRNVPRTRKALQQAQRVLKKGGRFMCLQFSKVVNPLFRQVYKQYSFNVIPEMGRLITGDKDSYQYLVESIERFLSQEQLKTMMEEVGFVECTYQNMTDGVVAIHSGFKI